MISCPVGAIVKHAEIADLIVALEDALQWNQSILNGEVVESRLRTDAKMRATCKFHTARVQRFSVLKRSLQKRQRQVRVHRRSSAAKSGGAA